MKPLVENAASIRTHTQDFGLKTTRLLESALQPYTVPVFGIACSTLKTHCKSKPTVAECEALAQVILENLNAPLIVRSSALSEDGSTSAHAGEYQSVVAQSNAAVTSAVLQVLIDAYEKNHDLGTFSLLIQPYMKPTQSGVLFTRDPHGGILSVIAWNDGAATDVVMGKQSNEHV
ncbi:MAG: hypothetical protein RI911_793, partial [Candidatus Parcubacteria bacterium]